MKEGYKALNIEMDTGPLGMVHDMIMYREFFITRDYDWWRPVRKGDVVVDVGACVGFFSCTALDYGAKKVYMLEPNKELLKICVKNTLEYVIDAPESPVIPVHAAIGEDPKHMNHIFGDVADLTRLDFPLIPFMDFVKKFDLQHIDYLKLDCEGGEYSVLTPENYEWISKNVDHIAMEVHLRSDETAPADFIKFRDGFLKPFIEQGKVRFMAQDMISRIFDDKAILNRDYSRVPAEFMMYILINEN